MKTLHGLILLLLLTLSSNRLVHCALEEVDSDTTSDTSDQSIQITEDESATDVQNKAREISQSIKVSTIKAIEEKKTFTSITKTTTTSSNNNNNNIDDKESHLDVIQLNSRNFGKHISDGNIWLIEFYSPHCSHCVDFESSYADIARHYHSQSATSSSSTASIKKKKKKQRHVKVGKVNGEIERALVSRFAIAGYPSFFLIEGYSVYQYDDVRLKKNLIAFTDGGYKKYAAIPFNASPMGPLGILQGTLMSSGHIFFDVFQWTQDTFGLSPLLVGIIFFGCMFLGCFVLIVLLALIIPEKPKRD
jgi:thiol-disulfide isomerase/thioredoxin